MRDAIVHWTDAASSMLSYMKHAAGVEEAQLRAQFDIAEDFGDGWLVSLLSPNELNDSSQNSR